MPLARVMSLSFVYFSYVYSRPPRGSGLNHLLISGKFNESYGQKKPRNANKYLCLNQIYKKNPSFGKSELLRVRINKNKLIQK